MKSIDRSRFIIGATNAPGVLDVERLSAGTIVVDDSFPHCFETDRAIGRMASRGDVLLVEGGFVSPPGAIEWRLMLPPNLAPIFGAHRATSLLTDPSAITACILSSLLSEQHGAAATTGPVGAAACLDHWQALERLGIGAAPLRCASWSPTAAYMAAFSRNSRSAEE